VDIFNLKWINKGSEGHAEWQAYEISSGEALKLQR
jgi:hypothetical protein